MKAPTLLIALVLGSFTPANVATPSANIAIPNTETAEVVELATQTVVETPLLGPYGICGAR